ncbi:MAG: putative NADH-flavin reductase [Oceanospirillaceae bacterium]|jgi:putative NADH-flavin reductase
MKITVLGATGKAGSRVITEALARGHEVTAVVRNPAAISNLPTGIKVITGDASNIVDVTAFSTGQDVVISAIRPASGLESEVIATTQTLMDGLSKTGARLLVVGGASTLTVPGTGGKTVIEDANYLPVSARHIGKASADQLEVCLAENRVDWAYLSPAAQFARGERTGKYRMGTDVLLVDGEGISKISMEDAAIVLLDEAEEPKHHQSRFTVAY